VVSPRWLFAFGRGLSFFGLVSLRSCQVRAVRFVPALAVKRSCGYGVACVRGS
jgi:hypothetical protein